MLLDDEDRIKRSEDFDPEINYADTAVGKILCRQYYCVYCHDAINSGMKERYKGSRAFLEAILSYDGMLCGSGLWMREVAREGLNKQ